MSPDGVLGLIAGFALGVVTACLLFSIWPEDARLARRLYVEYRVWQATRGRNDTAHRR